MKKIFVAGAINGSSYYETFNNLRKGIKLSSQVLQEGYAVFSPFIDYSYFLQEDITEETIKKSTMEFLKICDAVLLVDGWNCSRGVLNELHECRLHQIPVFNSIESLNDHFRHLEL